MENILISDSVSDDGFVRLKEELEMPLNRMSENHIVMTQNDRFKSIYGEKEQQLPK